MLSRLPLSNTAAISNSFHIIHSLCEMQINHLPVNAEKVRHETMQDPELKIVVESLENNSWELNKSKISPPFYSRRNELSLENGIILWGLRVVLPSNLRKQIIDELHYQHPGIVRMKSLARVHVWYPNIDKDIEMRVQGCTQCVKVANEPPKAQSHPWAWPSGPMDRIHLDFFGPFMGKCILLWSIALANGVKW